MKHELTAPMVVLHLPVSYSPEPVKRVGRTNMVTQLRAARASMNITWGLTGN